MRRALHVAVIVASSVASVACPAPRRAAPRRATPAAPTAKGPTSKPKKLPAPRTPPCLATLAVDRSSGKAICSARLGAEKIALSSKSCWVDALVHRVAGTLRFPCAGGPIELVFGRHRFTGSVRHCSVEARAITVFPWRDGCKWRSEQRIRGALGRGRLRYSYREAPLPGQSGCWTSSCTATAELAIW